MFCHFACLDLLTTFIWLSTIIADIVLADSDCVLARLDAVGRCDQELLVDDGGTAEIAVPFVRARLFMRLGRGGEKQTRSLAW